MITLLYICFAFMLTGVIGMVILLVGIVKQQSRRENSKILMRSKVTYEYWGTDVILTCEPLNIMIACNFYKDINQNRKWVDTAFETILNNFVNIK